MAAFLTLAGGWDLKARRVPNWLTLPALAVVLAWRAARFVLSSARGAPGAAELTFLVPWAVIVLALWPLRVFGGGDCKVLMVLFGVFPTWDMFILALLVSGLVIGVVLIWRYAHQRRLGHLAIWLWSRLSTGQLRPTDEELAARGEPTAFLFAAAGLCMLILQLA